MTDELFRKVCDEISFTTKGLKTICESYGSTAQAFCYFRNKHEWALELYARAKEDQADFLADEILEQSYKRENDDTPFTGVNHIQRDRLITDNLKFIAAKLKPKRYGDKLDIEQTIKHEQPLFPDINYGIQEDNGN